LIAAFADLSEGAKLETNRAVLVDEIIKPLAESWTTAPTSIINPEDKPELALAESVAQGRELYYSTKANCVKCHGPAALGDGQANDYDDWSKPLAEMEKGIVDERARLKTDTEISGEDRRATQTRLAFDAQVLKSDALPPRTITPRNLRQGIYRGGRRPLDLYRRIYAGINGAPMPGVGPASPGAQGTLTPQEIWALVDYVRSLPYEAVSEPPKAQHGSVEQARF
jgi:mono/diheme cytochrome c family protein